VRAYAKGDEEGDKQSLFGSITEALDFSQVRSEKDAELLYEARESTRGGGRMTREQVCIMQSNCGSIMLCYHP
jgi:hypothetical protein